MNPNLIEVRNLKKYFKTGRGMLHAVDNVSFNIPNGNTLGVVGESGCGKSTLGRTLIHLLEPTSGEIIFDGEDISVVSRAKLKALREEMQMIFQDPFSSLNPRMSVFESIAEPLRIYRKHSSNKELTKRVFEIMDTVGLEKRLTNTFPHELDGGRRQRIGVGRALALKPKFLVCDEPVSALDVSIQAQILNLLQDLQAEFKLTLMFITHDMSVVRHISDDLVVMYLGTTVEFSEAERIFEQRLHPYTNALLSAVPIPSIHVKNKPKMLKGEISSPIDPPDECRFAKRCPYARAACFKTMPQLREVQPQHFVACHFAEAIASGELKPENTEVS